MTREDEIRARKDAATPGPWRVGWCEAHHAYEFTRNDGRNILVMNKGTSEFIAHALDDIDYLLSEVERLEAQLDARNIELLDALEGQRYVWERSQRLEAVIEAVRELHQRRVTARDSQGTARAVRCSECATWGWPCKTVAALTETTRYPHPEWKHDTPYGPGVDMSQICETCGGRGHSACGIGAALTEKEARNG